VVSADNTDAVVSDDRLPPEVWPELGSVADAVLRIVQVVGKLRDLAMHRADHAGDVGLPCVPDLSILADDAFRRSSHSEAPQ